MPATTALISIEEYLTTMYRPDCDYVDGEVQERNLGEWDHGRLQIRLGAYLLNREREWNIRVITELRTRVSATRVRIPDICVLNMSHPRQPVLSTPPFLCIEVLSPSDNFVHVQKRIADFHELGVPYTWLIDTESRRAWVNSVEVVDGVLRAEQIEVPIAELFDNE